MRKTASILVVDDNEINRMVLKAQLKHLQADVLDVASGQDAVAAFMQFDHHMILMDCHMPGMDGFETTRELRRLEEHSGRSRRPIIAVTSDDRSGIIDRCRDSGMDDYLLTPLRLATLVSTLEKWLPEMAHP